ncbi:hypothetical protein BN1221_02841 [Brenneria goodwinii]|uniref:Uncharacterized protein n=1 Tax=Brenneria goodwinii TaxID=1109412 RepID=A0A0G4JWN5_9GAMM|nr:hypothetical protein BN1221_02841 [Brenneria goodwinii]
MINTSQEYSVVGCMFVSSRKKEGKTDGSTQRFIHVLIFMAL